MMQAVITALVLLLAVLICGVAARLLPLKIPLPILQIVAGVLLSVAARLQVPLEPEIFFLLFIPPLLFLDGWRIPKGALFGDWRPILTLAVGLVACTMLGVGWFIAALIPAVPLTLAFALAAILSPTDPVAVSAILRGVPIPPRLMHILEGEALLNDASGLVCFRFAVGAALTGAFSLSQASGSFLLTAAGGLAAGAAIAWAASALYHLLTRHRGEESGSQILISILIPFAAYLAAEHVRASGILAAASAGVSMHYADLMGRSLGETRMRRSAVWDMLQTSLNGIIFVLLGLQLPGIISQMPSIAKSAGVGGSSWLIVYIVVITAALWCVRFGWTVVSLLVMRFFAWRRAEPRTFPGLLLPCVAAFAGVRGAVTLAGILTLPFVMSDGSPFPARDLAIFIATGVILLWLIVASMVLPVLAVRLPYTEGMLPASQEAAARSAAAEAAIRRVEEVRDQASADTRDTHAEAAARVVDVYRRRVEYGGSGDETERNVRVRQAERRLRAVGARAERDEYHRLRLSRQIDDSIYQKLLRELDVLEATPPPPPQNPV
jgi:CPA1 family monovalent cation:H+ antiporter